MAGLSWIKDSKLVAVNHVNGVLYFSHNINVGSHDEDGLKHNAYGPTRKRVALFM